MKDYTYLWVLGPQFITKKKLADITVYVHNLSTQEAEERRSQF